MRRGVAQLEARCVWDAEVGGSSPPTPTEFLNFLPFNLTNEFYLPKIFSQIIPRIFQCHLLIIYHWFILKYRITMFFNYLVFPKAAK